MTNGGFIMVNATGYELFSISDNFLTELTAEDESIITGGGKYKHGKSKSRKNKKYKRSRSKSKSKSRKYCKY
jgi:hypothetical protein